jgi:hypothetical protein
MALHFLYFYRSFDADSSYVACEHGPNATAVSCPGISALAASWTYELAGVTTAARLRTTKLAALSSAILAAWGTTSCCQLLRHLTLFFFYGVASLCNSRLGGVREPHNPLVAYSPPARTALLTGVTFDAKFYLKYLIFFYTSGLVTSPHKSLQDMRGRVGRVPMPWPLLSTFFCLGIREDLLELGLKRHGNFAKAVAFVILCRSCADRHRTPRLVASGGHGHPAHWLWRAADAVLC